MLLHESCNCMQWQQPCMQQAIQGSGSRVKEMLVGQELLGRQRHQKELLNHNLHTVFCTSLALDVHPWNILNVPQSPYPLLPPKQP